MESQPMDIQQHHYPPGVQTEQDRGEFEYLMSFSPDREARQRPDAKALSRCAAPRTRAPRRTAVRSRRPAARRVTRTTAGPPGDSDPAPEPGDRRHEVAL